MAANRIRYIDAMRGTTMLLVVYGHVMYHSLGITDVITHFTASVRMPAFFFISGYIAYKAVSQWDATFFKARLKKKAMVQIIPTLVFFIAFSLINARSPISDYVADGFGPYWFTISLFEMFCIYFTLSRLGNAMHRPWVTYVGLIAFAIIGLIYTYCFEWNKPDYYQLRHTADFFQFFVLGVFCRAGGQRFHDFIDRKPVRWSIIGIFAAMAVTAPVIYMGGGNDIVEAIWHSEIMNIMRGYVGVIAIYTIFRSLSTFFNRDATVPNIFSFVGRRTLDIYMIHYFFLPDLKTTLAPWLQTHGHTLGTFVFALTMAIVVTALSLLVSRIIRVSPFLARYLFGANPNNP